MLSVCLWIPPVNLWMAEPIFIKLGMYIMAPEPISTTYFINLSRKSVCLYVYSSFFFFVVIARQQVEKHVPVVTNKRNNRWTVGRIVIYQVRVLTKWDSVKVCLCIPLSLLGNNSVKKFPRQGSFVGGVVFYAVQAVSKETRRLVISRISYLISSTINQYNLKNTKLFYIIQLNLYRS
jgi:hypothetical protein